MYAAYKPNVAEDNKNAMVKEIYSRCFDWIVKRINELMIDTTKSVSKSEENDYSRIGVLDIFGFEIFPKVKYNESFKKNNHPFVPIYLFRIHSSSFASIWLTRRCSSTLITTSFKLR